jgi:dTDP-4-amino-4,6-dideoxygalactose transaminase
MEWKIPLSDMDIGEQEIQAVTEVLRSKWLTMGEVTKKFEESFARYIGAKYAFGVTNCTDGLHLALRALDIGSGDDVICPSLTFVATSNSIIYTGATPVFADISSLDNFNISPDDIQKKLTRKTKAIIVVHYGGYPCNMEKIMQIAKDHGLFVIEDDAHAPGAEYQGNKCGVIGDIGCFSFFSNKNMATGEGGMITTNQEQIAKKIGLLRSHGMTTLTLDRHKGHAFSYDVVELGYNCRIDEMRSAMGIVQLSKLENNNLKRKSIVAGYRNLLKDIPGISIPFSSFEGTSSYHLAPVLLSEGYRDIVMAELKKSGIQTSIHYQPVHLFRYYRNRYGFSEGILPLTEKVAKMEMTLPLFPAMTEEDVKYVVSRISAMISL